MNLVEGFVYVLSNECMPDIYKVGYTTKSVKGRIEELSRSTSIPMPFKEEFSFYALDVERAEKLMHEALKEYRISQTKEFFKVDLETIEMKSMCLYPDYHSIIRKIAEDTQLTGEYYYKHTFKSFLDQNLDALKEEEFNFECFTDIYKKGNEYYIALCAVKVCTEEEYGEWVKVQCKADNTMMGCAEQNIDKDASVNC